ncbi:MAG: hydantoinase B/oxoprolinase family protein, partial [Bacteroidota bacterium]
MWHCLAKMINDVQSALAKEGFAPAEIVIKHRYLYLRFLGQSSTLEIDLNQLNDMAYPDIVQQFEKKYRKLFGHWPSQLPVELESIKVIGANRASPISAAKPLVAPFLAQTDHYIYPILENEARLPAYDWETLQAGAQFQGPAILMNAHATAYIGENWQVDIDSQRNAKLTFQGKTIPETIRENQEVVELELFTNRFMAIAKEMGAQLQRTAFSVNIKERLDFSCALLDADATLLVNAPHIPVHLGSLGICARLVIEELDLGPGDVIITNHPKYGGSHLPDVNLLMAVFSKSGERIGYVINRAHHAEIGGSRPGSMPPTANRLIEEGVVIAPMYLVKNGTINWQSIEKLLREAPYPSRAVRENLADINAALAALKTGEAALQHLVQQHGLVKVRHYMQALKDAANTALWKALLPYQQNKFEAIERLDDGHEIRVNIEVHSNQMRFDFNGTSAVHPHNLNANLSIVHSAIIYVLRLLCDSTIPLNEGLMQNVQIDLPRCFLNPNFPEAIARCPAVVGGNTECSQRLVDTLLKAFGLVACSQGTMNNFLFGNETFGYYETIGGGTGAGPGFDGRSAVHQHMTNTKITDSEELEF